MERLNASERDTHRQGTHATCHAKTASASPATSALYLVAFPACVARRGGGWEIPDDKIPFVHDSAPQQEEQQQADEVQEIKSDDDLAQVQPLDTSLELQRGFAPEQSSPETDQADSRGGGEDTDVPGRGGAKDTDVPGRGGS